MGSKYTVIIVLFIFLFLFGCLESNDKTASNVELEQEDMLSWLQLNSSCKDVFIFEKNNNKLQIYPSKMVSSKLNSANITITFNREIICDAVCMNQSVAESLDLYCKDFQKFIDTLN